MTNEQLAQLIGEGGNDELIPLLWEKTRPHFGKIAAAFFTRYRELCTRYSVTVSDLKQEGYFALLKGIERYNKRPERLRDNELLCFCRLPFKARMYTCIGLDSRKESDRFDAHTNAVYSLDMPLEIEGDKASRADIIPDSAALEKIETECEKIKDEYNSYLVDLILNKILTNDKEKAVIKRFYLDGETLNDIAKSLECSVPVLTNFRNRVLKRLRNNELLLDAVTWVDFYYGRGKDGCSVVERIVEAKETMSVYRHNIKAMSALYETEPEKFACEEDYYLTRSSVWVFDESRRIPNYHSSCITDPELELIEKEIQKNAKITALQLRKKLTSQVSEPQIRKIIRKLSYTKTNPKPSGKKQISHRIWVYNPGTRRYLGKIRKYDVDVELIDEILKKEPGLKAKELKEKLQTPMPIGRLKDVLRRLGYTSEYVYK